MDVGSTPDPGLEIALRYKPTEFTTVNATHREWEPVDVPEPVNLQQLFAPFLAGPFANYEVSVI